MKRLSAFRKMTVAAACCVFAFAACTDDDADDGTTLPDGKYPMAFTAGVDGLAATRATTDNTWTGGEEVAVQIGSEVKKYTAATNNTLSAAEGVTPWYWQNTTETKTVSAWYPYSDTKPAANELKVKADQSGNGYGQSDHLEAAEATVTFRSPALTFKHRTAKVVVTLKGGNGVADVSSATVWFLNQTGVESGGTEITPKTVTTDGTATYTALVIPQQMQGEKFIKVTIGTGGAARDYFYIPTGNNDANLEAGKQYTYTITVKKTGLEVAVASIPAWGTGGETTGGSEEVSSFSVKIPTVLGVTPTIEGATGSGGEIYTTTGNSFSITLSVGDGMTGFSIKGGVCDVKRTIENGSYKSTYSNIRSDLELVYCDYVEVGDYYNNDGVWSKYYDETKSIGIVFKVGAAQEDVASNYDGKLTDGIHGYVVALTDALTYAGEWGARDTDENNEFLPDVSSNTDTKYNGYTQTKYILDTHSTDLTRYEAFSAVKGYATTAPANSSGWYLPSMKQLSDVWQLYKGAAGNMLYDRLYAIGSDNLFQTGNAGGNHNKDNKYRYWTSTEKNSTDAWYVIFDTNGTIDAYAKDNGYDRLCRARAILTF